MDPSSTNHEGISGTPSTATQPHTETAPGTVAQEQTTVNIFSSRLTGLQSVVLSALLLSFAYFFFVFSPWIVGNKADYGRETEYTVAFGPLFEPPESTKVPPRLHLGILTMQVIVFLVFGSTLVYLAGRPLLKYVLLVPVAAFLMMAVLEYIIFEH